MKRRTILQAIGGLVAGLVANFRGFGGQVRQTVKRAVTSPTAAWTHVTPTPVTMNLPVPDQGDYEGTYYTHTQAQQKLKGAWAFRSVNGYGGTMLPAARLPVPREGEPQGWAFAPVRLKNEQQTGYVVATLNNPARAPRANMAVRENEVEAVRMAYDRYPRHPYPES